jgi:hypothetical protein
MEGKSRVYKSVSQLANDIAWSYCCSPIKRGCVSYSDDKAQNMFFTH